MYKKIRTVNELEFRMSQDDMFAVYHVRKSAAYKEFADKDLEYLKQIGKKAEPETYEFAYAAKLYPEMNAELIVHKEWDDGDYLPCAIFLADLIIVRRNQVVEVWYVDNNNPIDITSDFRRIPYMRYAAVVEDRFIAVEETDDGYDYKIYRDDFTELDSGKYNEPTLTILEAFYEILKGMIADEVTHPRVWHSEAVQVDYDKLGDYAREAALNLLKGKETDVVTLYRKRNELFLMQKYYNMYWLIEHNTRIYINSKIKAECLDVKVRDVILTGSRSRRIECPDSNMEFLVEYDGDCPEDFLFNFFHEKDFEIDGFKINITPVKAEETGTLEEILPKHEKHFADKRTLQALEKNFPLQKVVEKLIEKGHNARVQNVEKGEISYQGIAIEPDGIRDGISPVIRYEYLLQEKGACGWTLDRVASAVLEIHEKNIIVIPDLNKRYELEFIIPRLHICLQKSSEAEIEKRPFELTDGIEEYLCVFMEDENGNFCKSDIKKGFLEQSGLPLAIAWKIAEENNFKDTKILSITFPLGLTLTVVTNSYGCEGAACIRNMDALKNYAAAHGYTGRFLVCPSSVDEMIILPAENMDENLNLEAFSNIVRCANRDGVEPENRLADHAFLIEV